MSHLAAAQAASHKRHVSPEHPCRARKSRCHTARFTAERTPAEALNSLQFAYPEINDENGGPRFSLLNAVLGFDIYMYIFFFFSVFEFCHFFAVEVGRALRFVVGENVNGAWSYA